MLLLTLILIFPKKSEATVAVHELFLLSNGLQLVPSWVNPLMVNGDS